MPNKKAIIKNQKKELQEENTESKIGNYLKSR